MNGLDELAEVEDFPMVLIVALRSFFGLPSLRAAQARWKGGLMVAKSFVELCLGKTSN